MNTPITVKVCGITDPAAARAALEAGVDYLGLVFARSPRQVDPATAERLVEVVAADWIGVFVDPDPAGVVDAVERLGLHAVQLHGGESPETCRAIRLGCGRPVWKAIRWNLDPDRFDAYAEVADALLVDAARGDRFGGTGRTLPWERLASRLPDRPRRIPVVLAGGLDPDNVAAAIDAVDPDGVDASSRLERAPGQKDPDRVRRFVAAARAAGENRAGKTPPSARAGDR